MVVKAELEKLGLRYVYVKIGEADIIGDVKPEQLEQLKLDLKKAGLVLMDNKKSVLVEKIKSAIIAYINVSSTQ